MFSLVRKRGSRALWILLGPMGLLAAPCPATADPGCAAAYGEVERREQLLAGAGLDSQRPALERWTSAFEQSTWTTKNGRALVHGKKGFLELGGGTRPFVTIDEPAAGGGKTLVLVHGFGQSSNFFNALADELIERHGTRVVRIDLTNSGQTLLQNGERLAPTLQDDADLVRNVLEKLDLKDVVLVGHSRGHAVTALVANQVPGRISYHVAVNPYVRWLPDYFFSTALYPQQEMMRQWARFLDPQSRLGIGASVDAYFQQLQQGFRGAVDTHAFTPFSPLSLENLLSQVPEGVGLDEFNSGPFRQRQIHAAIEVAKGMSPDKDRNIADITPLYSQPGLLSTKTLIIGGGKDYRFAPAGVTESLELIKRQNDLKEGTHTIEKAVAAEGDHFLPAREPGTVVDMMEKAFSGGVFKQE